MQPITIAGEPYMFAKVDKLMFLWMNIPRTKYTLIDSGEYILLDRHFNCFYMTEAQMKACIDSDFKRWRRPDLEPLPTKEDEND